MIKSLVAESARSFQTYLNRLGPWRFGVLFALIMTSLLWLVGGIISFQWGHGDALNNTLGNIGRRDFVCFCSDVTTQDLCDGVAEGFTGVTGALRELDAARTLDAPIIATHWLTRAQVLERAARLRTPLVLRCIDDYLAGTRLPLGALTSLVEAATMSAWEPHPPSV